jgi:NADPH:quinone reductase-like Zn-dependent oxidoreductase
VKAVRFDRYGPPEVLELRDVDLPAVGDDEVLVRVRAASANPLDWHFMRGMPYLVRLQAGLSRP